MHKGAVTCQSGSEGRERERKMEGAEDQVEDTEEETEVRRQKGYLLVTHREQGAWFPFYALTAALILTMVPRTPWHPTLPQ